MCAGFRDMNTETRLGLKALDFCLAQRRLRWAGHVYRMSCDRLPRRLLTSWVDHPRPRGRPQFHYGHGLARDLKGEGVDVATWHLAAANRIAWLRLTQQPDLCSFNKPQTSTQQNSPTSPTSSLPHTMTSTPTPPLHPPPGPTRRRRLRLRLQQPRRPLLSALVLPPPQYSLFPSPLSPAPLPSFLFPRCAGAADAWPIRQGSQAAVEYTLSNPSSTPKHLLFPTALSSSNPLPWVSIKRRRRRRKTRHF